MVRVLGVDACPTGWVGVLLDGDELEAWYGGALADLVAAAEGTGPVACVAVDIPLGLPDTTTRQADVLARSELGPRRSSLFTTATRAAYEAGTFAEANATQRALTGSGLSQQSYRLGPKLLDANAFALRGSHRVVEAHPELSFARMGDGPLRASKKTWTGQHQRQDLLRLQGIDVTLLGHAGEAGRHAGPDDLLDAAAMAWTARRYAEGQASSYPQEPEVFRDGLPAAIWF